MKKGKEGLVYGLRIQDFHPGVVHNAVARAEVIRF